MCYIPTSELAGGPDYLDIGFKLATICIALFNVLFAIRIFKVKTKTDSRDKESDRKIQLLKTLHLDHHLSNLYNFFELLDENVLPLKKAFLSNKQKQEVDSKVGENFIYLRRKFYDPLIAIDDGLYENIKTQADTLQGEISHAIFNAEIDLLDLSQFDELIAERIAVMKANVIKLLFSYRG